ncbi:Protein stoned-B [Halotydeus destructor]|nr:Protein stoned-B [Halotydeus destructor]
MNFLKKKLKSHKRGHEDPEDFDDYIPVAPPHPSDLARQQLEAEKLKNATPEQLKEIEEKRLREEERQKDIQEKRRNSEGWKFFEQLSAKVTTTVATSLETVKKIKDSTLADDLTREAEAELGFVVPTSPEERDEQDTEKGAKFAKGQWVGFGEGGSGDQRRDSVPSGQRRDSVPSGQRSRRDSVVRVVGVLTRAASVIRDRVVGVETPPVPGPASAPVATPTPAPGAVEEEDDPFDTAYVDVSLVDKKVAEDLLLAKKRIEEDLERKKQEAQEEQIRYKAYLDSKPEPLPDLEPEEDSIDEPEPEPVESSVEVEPDNLVLSSDDQDPEDTKMAENLDEDIISPELDIDPNCDPQIASIYRHGVKVLKKFGSNTSLASILSNPFLNEGDVDFYASGTVTPYSGGTTPNRSYSTHRFDASPQDETASGLTDAIAAMTQDFCMAVADEPETKPLPTKPKPPRPDVPPAVAPPVKPPPPADFQPTQPEVAEVVAKEKVVPPKPPPPKPAPPTVVPPIVTKAPTIESPHDSDDSSPGVAPPAPTPIDPTDSDTPFDPFATIHDDQSEHSNSNRPSLTSEVHEQSHLEAPVIPDYPSDVSDAEDAETFYANDDQVPGDGQPDGERRRSSAFQKEVNDSDKERKTSGSLPMKYFDPFQQVVDPLSPMSPDKSEADFSYKAHQDEHTPEEEEAPKNDIEPTSPEGVVNDAFEETAVMKEEIADEKTEEEEHKTEPEAVVEESPEAFDHQDDDLEPPTAPSDVPMVTSSDTAAAYEVTTANTEANENLEVAGASDSGIGAHDDNTDPGRDPFETSEVSIEPVTDALPITDNTAFDAFSSRFDSTSQHKVDDSVDAFSSPLHVSRDTTGAPSTDVSTGFDSGFDPFNTDHILPPKNTPIKLKKELSNDSFSSDEEDERQEIKIVIKAKMRDAGGEGSNKFSSLPVAPLLPPPPKTPTKGTREAETYKPGGKFEEYESLLAAKKRAMAEPPKEIKLPEPEEVAPALGTTKKRRESAESPSTPLFDEDTSQPLEDFPAKYAGDGWEMYIRHPPKKKLTANRFWKKIFVKVSSNCVIQLFNKKEDTDPFQEMPLQCSYSLSEASAQQYDQYGKIFTVKLQYIFYRERVGVRKGQIAKVIEGRIQSVGQIKSLGMPIEHAPQISELLKLGTLSYEDVRTFTQVVEEALFSLSLNREKALTYKTEEIQMTMQDEIYVEQNKIGIVTKQLARVRLFFIAFLNGMPVVEVGVNDMTRQGNEIVGRHDIMPVVTEEWIRIENYELHSNVDRDEFDKSRVIKLTPPDATYFELMRFRVRPPRNRELPLQVSANLLVTKTKVELHCDILVPGCVSRKHGQIPCEDIAIRFHMPECWIYLFRNEKHMRYGSIKSVNRRTGKIKGLERFLGATTNLEPEKLLETSAGQAKYEHVHRSLVWRIPRLPKEGQGAYTQQTLVMKLPLTSFDQVPDLFNEFVNVEFTMPSTTVSHAVIRSISATTEEPPEKFVRYVAKYDIKVGMTVTFNYDDTPSDYVAAAGGSVKTPETVQEASGEKGDDHEDSDSD